MVNTSQEVEKDVIISEKVNDISLEEKAVNQEPLTYADKLVFHRAGRILFFLIVAFLGIHILTIVFLSLLLGGKKCV